VSETEANSVRLPDGSLELLDIPGDADAPPIVLLHQGVGSLGLWREFPNSLARLTGRRTIAYSRYGHGQSDPPPRPRTPSFMHEEALELLPKLLAQLDAATPVLVGHSDGASIALIHAAHHPVQGVAAIAPHVFVEEVSIAEILRIREAYVHDGLRERMARHHRDPDAAFYGWNSVWLDPQFADWDLRPLLHRITCPLLLIQGERDQYGTMAQLDAIERAASGPVERLHLDCRHAPHAEQPEATIDSIVRFIERLDVG
jgi:pimeloyl-ACP methyl ester carboxylesterase